MSRTWVAITLSGAGTFAMRASFLALAHRLATVPPPVARVLRQIPPATLAALLVPAIVRPSGELDLLQPRVLATAVATLIAWRTGSAALTLVLGMVVLAVLQAL